MYIFGKHYREMVWVRCTNKNRGNRELMKKLVVAIVLALVAIVDIVRAHETRGPKWLWIIVSLVVNTIGPILYFIIGRKNQ